MQWLKKSQDSASTAEPADVRIPEADSLISETKTRITMTKTMNMKQSSNFATTESRSFKLAVIDFLSRADFDTDSLKFSMLMSPFHVLVEHAESRLSLVVIVESIA